MKRVRGSGDWLCSCWYFYCTVFCLRYCCGSISGFDLLSVNHWMPFSFIFFPVKRLGAAMFPKQRVQRKRPVGTARLNEISNPRAHQTPE